MRGRAELVVISQVEMQGDDAPHLRDIVAKVARHEAGVSKAPALTEQDKLLLERFGEALDEAAEQARKELAKLRPLDAAGDWHPETFADPG